jgi:ribosomal protein RSM22 (predicted rRNA methylase)
MADDVKVLAVNVLKLSKLLTKDRESLPAAYLKDPDLRHAYLRYYLPSNMKKVHLALTDLSLHPGWFLSKPKLRILDIGAGPGTALLGLLAFFAQRSERPSLACVAVDRVGENLRIAEDLFNSYRTNKNLDASLTTLRMDVEASRRITDDPFDLVIFSNILNELFAFDEDRIERRVTIVQAVLDANLAADGSAIIIEPALRETSRDLIEMRDCLQERGLHVFSPCLAASPCPALANPRDWCHEDIPWEPPALVREIDKLTGLRKDSLKFSYLVMRKDTHALADIFGPDAYRVVSEPLVTNGKIEFYVCGRHGRKLITRLDKDRSPLNVHFEKMRRGAIVGFEHLSDEGNRLRVERLTEVVIHKHVQDGKS